MAECAGRKPKMIPWLVPRKKNIDSIVGWFEDIYWPVSSVGDDEWIIGIFGADAEKETTSRHPIYRGSFKVGPY